jgi:hypothetical protein
MKSNQSEFKEGSFLVSKCFQKWDTIFRQRYVFALMSDTIVPNTRLRDNE